MAISEDEKARREANDKLIGETFKQEMKERKGFDKKRFFSNFIGIFIGLMITNVIRDNSSLSGILLCVIEIVIMVVMITLAELVISAIGKIAGRK